MGSSEERVNRTGFSLINFRKITSASGFYLFIILGFMCAVFAGFAPASFLSEFNIRTLFTDMAVLLVLAIGQTFVITTAGIDLSIGSILVFSGVMANMAMIGMGGKGPESLLVGLLVSLISGLIWGIINGFVITKMRIPALIATLGTMGISLGLVYVITDGTDMGQIPTELPDVLGIGRMFGVIPWLVVIAVVVAAVGLVIFKKTKFGMYTVAIGSSPEASRRAGINVDAHLIKIYAISGLLSGLAGYMSLARFASTTIAGHSNDGLQAITAVVLGGTSLFGGIVSVIGTVIGVFIPVILQNGLILLNVQPFWQQVVIGIILILAVYMDQFKRKERKPKI